MQKILEARIEYKENQIERVTVLIDCTSPGSKAFGDVRAIFANTKPRAGYMNIMPGTQLSESLLQEVADYGLETVDRDEIFPKWKAKMTKQG